MFFTGLVMDITLTWSTCALLRFQQEKKKRRVTNMEFLRKIKIRHSSVLGFEIRHLGYLVAQRATSYKLLQLISLCQKGLLCSTFFLTVLNHAYFVAVEWVLTFEIWFAKVGSKQNNIIYCT